MHDDDGKLIQACKDMIKKMAAAAVQGKVADMFSISTPAQIHHHISHLNLAANDASFANWLTKASTL